MFRAAVKSIWAHKLRSGLLSLAILAGVSFVVAAFVFTDTIGEAFDNLFADAFAATDIQVRREIDPELNFGLPERMPEVVVILILLVLIPYLSEEPVHGHSSEVAEQLLPLLLITVL